MNIPVRNELVALLKTQRLLMARFAAASIGRTLLIMASVLLIREFLFAILGQGQGVAATMRDAIGSESALTAVALLLVLSYIGTSILSFESQVSRQRLIKVFELSLMDRLVRHLLGLSVRFFDRSSRGDLIHALRQDVVDLRNVFLSLASILMESAVALGMIAVAVWISPRLAFWALFVLPIASLPLVLIARRTRRRSFAERRSAYVVFDVILQILRGIRIIKAFQGEEQEARTTIEKASRYFDDQIHLVRTRALSTVVLESLAGLSIAAVIIAGGLQVMHGALEWPQLLSFLMAVRAMHGPLDHINLDLLLIQSYGAAAHRIESLLAERPDLAERPGAAPLRSPVRSVAADGVSFRYDDRLVLDDVSFTLGPGETLGIAGPSGAGKTTLLGLVARFYDPTGGAVRFDARDLRDVPLADVYRQIAIVTQEPFVFESTVRENIRCGRPDASDAEVEQAAQSAEIHDEILALPQGYETVLGVGGRSLSGGQAQRLNVARAILKNAPILLLDEATSSLDSISEANVQRAVDRLQRGRTSLIVAHRLSTLRHADRILVLDRGRAVGLGPHDELLATCPLYRRMWEAQRLEPAAPARRPAEPETAEDIDPEMPELADEDRPA